MRVRDFRAGRENTVTEHLATKARPPRPVRRTAAVTVENRHDVPHDRAKHRHQYLGSASPPLGIAMRATNWL